MHSHEPWSVMTLWAHGWRLDMDPTSTGRPAGRLAYILDDEPEICELISQIVSTVGFTARSFGQATSLEMALTEAVPDVIVLDLSLGSSDGIDVIRSLAGSRFGGAVLLISGRHDEATINEVFRIGKRYGLVMLPFLQKPFRLDQFKDRLRLLGTLSPAAPADATFENALRNNQLELWYQPKINLKTRALGGAEALIRLRHPTRGILRPGEFLPPSGDPLHHPLADFVIRRALTDWAFFAAHDISLKVSINIPISIFETPEFVASLRKYLPSEANFPGLTVELTEDEVIRDPDLAREVAIQLKLYNIDVSIDDFGSGYATLEQAALLPFAELKIDHSKVDGCSRDLVQHRECRGIVDLAHGLGMVVVAEGVENLGDLDAVTDMGCDMAQGFVVASPMERDAFKQWVGRA
jgi:EAL domain-containing protein (putative c-di-GMP-specific phosphodiesterase class I)/ActR/RegA family two-component response regulator